MEELVKDKIVEWATRYAMNVTNTLMRNFWTNILFFWRIVVLGSVGGPISKMFPTGFFAFFYLILKWHNICMVMKELGINVFATLYSLFNFCWQLKTTWGNMHEWSWMSSYCSLCVMNEFIFGLALQKKK